MGVNGQKRKKKQGPVPSLEESLPKKFKSDKSVVKRKKSANGVKSNGTAKTKSTAVAVEVHKVEEVDDIADEHQDFGAAKSSLFDDDEEDVDEFEGLEDEVDMYLSETGR
jgi:hypothetical protein